MQDGFTLIRGERGADSVYRNGELIGTLYGDELSIPSIFPSLVLGFALPALESAYRAPDGGALRALVTSVD